MTESEFLAVAEPTLAMLEQCLEQAADRADLEIECSRSGNVLEIELIDAGSKVIVNSQAAMQEIWVAAKSGGFHYRYVAGNWIDTRSGKELFAALAQIIGDQVGRTIELLAG